jgi:hypothetical protein
MGLAPHGKDDDNDGDGQYLDSDSRPFEDKPNPFPTPDGSRQLPPHPFGPAGCCSFQF